jgi:hypothetical protein
VLVGYAKCIARTTPISNEQAVPTQINVVLTWFEELKQIVPTGGK